MMLFSLSVLLQLLLHHYYHYTIFNITVTTTIIVPIGRESKYIFNNITIRLCLLLLVLLRT